MLVFSRARLKHGGFGRARRWRGYWRGAQGGGGGIEIIYSFIYLSMTNHRIKITSWSQNYKKIKKLLSKVWGASWDWDQVFPLSLWDKPLNPWGVQGSKYLILGFNWIHSNTVYSLDLHRKEVNILIFQNIKCFIWTVFIEVSMWANCTNNLTCR